MIDPAARARLEWWKLSLLDLDSARNPLLDARESSTCIAVSVPDPVALARLLASGGDVAVLAADDMRDGLATGLPASELASRIIAIRRHSAAARDDRGVHVVWLALGTLVWCDANQASHVAPLALWPIELERDEGVLRVVAARGIAPRFNDVLGEKLKRDFEILLAPTELGFVDGLDDLLAAAESIALTRPGWRVERSGRLGCFSFASHTLWRDLEDRGDDALLAPVVSHLAAGSGIAFAQPSGPAAAAVTSRAGTADLLAPLDADASQLQVVAAAAAGASFVLQSAPGTGTSQTIANLVAHCAAHGKTTLVVASKLASLDAVRDRLASVGLGELCLDLARCDRAPLIHQLGKLLDRTFRPGSGPAGDGRLAELRDTLDAHAHAMHRTGPLGRSLHDVLGRLVELRSTPCAALADSDAIGLDAATFDRRAEAVHDLAAAAITVEPVASHPWRASTLGELADPSHALAAIDEAAAASAALHAAVRDVASLVPGLVARTGRQLEALGGLAALAANSPRPGGELLTHLRNARPEQVDEEIALIRARGGGTLEAPRDPLSFLHLAARHRALAGEVASRFADPDVLDAAALWAQLKKWSNSMAPVRFVALRNVRSEIKAAAASDAIDGGELASDAAMIAALEAVIAERACRVALESADEPARRWFGELYGAAPDGQPGDRSDLADSPRARSLPPPIPPARSPRFVEKLDSALAWAADLRRAYEAVDVIGGDKGRSAAWRALVAQVAASPTDGGSNTDLAAFARLAAAVARWTPALAALATATGIAAAELAAGDDHLAALRERTEALRHAIDSLAPWVTFHRARHRTLACGVGPAVRALERGDLAASDLALAWERATLLAWIESELASTENLATFHGAAHHAHGAAFADLDRAALALVRSRVLARIAGSSPRTTAPEGELEALLAARSPDNTRTLRELFVASRSLVFKLAPCVLATPSAVAQHLDPALPRFDVIILDDASQLPTAEAVVALSRGEAAVIAGDSCLQRPAAVDGILDDALSARLPELRLAWHYRSRHEDLFAFANAQFYGDRLHVLPASQPSPDLGVAWRRIEGLDDSDRNQAEAEAVVAEVFARLRDPAQRARSIAVVTLSRTQQELIQDLLDAARVDDLAFPEAEPLLVKTVEDIQADVRDVVLLSLGCGPEAPLLAGTWGARRLAAAITRAREQLLVISSFAPEDIASPELQHVVDLLAFARSPRNTTTLDRPASPITGAIARALGERGWIVRHQVGGGAYKLDLAIVDPNDSERYVLAIEHDGPAYASAPVARDRDRLRTQVLAQLGWRLHRIWSLDWWTDPEREIQRAHAAIVTAIAANRQRRAAQREARPLIAGPGAARIPGSGYTEFGAARPRLASGSTPVVAEVAAPVGVPALEPTLPSLAAGSAPVRIARNTIPIGPYTAAAIPPGRRTPDDLFAPRHLAELGKVVEQVLAAEAPMHVDLLARRVGAYFGIGRVTQRVADQIRVAVEGRGKFGDETDVVWRLDQDPSSVPPVRVAGNSPTGRRDIEQIPLSELAAAARIVVERASGIATPDLIRDAARLMGFARITDQVTSRVSLGVKLAQVRELIAIDAGKVGLPD